MIVREDPTHIQGFRRVPWFSPLELSRDATCGQVSNMHDKISVDCHPYPDDVRVSLESSRSIKFSRFLDLGSRIDQLVIPVQRSAQ